MKKYTVRFAHLENRPLLQPGDTIKKGELVARMGSTGVSTAPHLHIDLLQGEVPEIWHQNDVRDEKYSVNLEQLLFFIDSDLFKVEPVVTTSFGDPEYLQQRNIIHYGFDLVPKDRHETNKHFNIFWNRSFDGKVLSSGNDKGYGNYINILYLT